MERLNRLYVCTTQRIKIKMTEGHAYRWLSHTARQLGCEIPDYDSLRLFMWHRKTYFEIAATRFMMVLLHDAAYREGVLPHYDNQALSLIASCETLLEAAEVLPNMTFGEAEEFMVEMRGRLERFKQEHSWIFMAPII